MRRDLISSALAIVVFTILLGLAYPLVTTGLAQLLFPNKADGSRIERGGEVVGSRLIGQEFQRPVLGRDGKPRQDAEGNPVLVPDPRYLQSRPSVTGYNPAGTFFNNLGPNQAELRDLFRDNLAAYLERERPANPGLTAADIPVDAVTTSGSGVDPHISEANARIQARRVARARRLPLERVHKLIEQSTDGRALGFLGEPGVNVLEANLALDEVATRSRAALERSEQERRSRNAAPESERG
ncbi:MAG: potassium-transporting ATPase subunit C [Nocardioidaceae bacterium]